MTARVRHDHKHSADDIYDLDVTPPAPIDSAGGSLSVTDGVNPPEDVTAIVAPGAVIGAGTATLATGVYAQITDPGAVGAGSVWKDLQAGQGTAAVWRERNSANDGWDQIITIRAEATGDDTAFAGSQAVAEDGPANGGSSAQTSGTGTATAGPVAQTSGAGDAFAGAQALTFSTGTAYAGPVAQAAGAGDADVTGIAIPTSGTGRAGSYVSRLGITAGMQAEVDGASARLAFNGVTPVAIPEVPAIPVPQDIVDALVALGLVTQAS